MANRCDNCNKGMIIGRQHTHHPGVAGGRWKKRAPQTRKVFKPNLHMSRVLVNGVFKRMKLCVKCIRLLKKVSKTVKEEVTVSQPPTA